MQHKILEGMPEDEGVSFLVLAPDYYGDELVWHQVSWFEGNLYPDAKSYVIDRSDQICLDGISAWVALPGIKQSKGNTMKNIKSTKNVNKVTTATSNEGDGLGSSKDAREGFMSDAIASKAFTAWAVEIDGEIDATDIRPTRAWARAMRNNYAACYPSEAKVSVRKVLIIPVVGR